MERRLAKDDAQWERDLAWDPNDDEALSSSGPVVHRTDRERLGIIFGEPMLREYATVDPGAPTGIRQFDTGANRDLDESKLDFEGFLRPDVLVRFAEFMQKHRRLTDGSLRDTDNWQLGIPSDVYIKSMMRHFMDVWLHHRDKGSLAVEEMEEALCGMMFNVMGYLANVLDEGDNNG